MSSPPSLAIGKVEAVFLARLLNILKSAQIQTKFNIDELLEERFKEITIEVLSEQFTILVETITRASSESQFSFKGYTYPSLDTSYIVDKQKDYGYTDAAPFKERRFSTGAKGSLVGTMAALAKDREAGLLMLNAFGKYRRTQVSTRNDDFTSLILDPKEREHFKEQAKKKLEELKSKARRS